MTATGTPNQKVAIIIGASEGFGAAIVDAYRGLNYAVVANSRSITPSNDPGVAAVAGDIAESATADRIVTTTVERFGRVDTLINNAGIFVSKPFTEYTVADYELVTAVNLTGFFHRHSSAEAWSFTAGRKPILVVWPVQRAASVGSILLFDVLLDDG